MSAKGDSGISELLVKRGKTRKHSSYVEVFEREHLWRFWEKREPRAIPVKVSRRSQATFDPNQVRMGLDLYKREHDD